MSLFLRSRFLFLALALPLSFLSCSKKEDAAPAPTTGTVEGTVSPAGALTTVTATNAGGLTFLAAPNATTGAFSLPNLAPGTYQLSFAPAATFAAPAARSVTVVAGQTASAGTVVVSPAPPTTGTLTGTISPAGAVTLVRVTNGSTGAVLTVVPSAGTGAFSVANLLPGTYTLDFTPAGGYDAPASRTIAVTAGAAAAVGTVLVALDSTIKSGTMTWTVNGATYSTTVVSGRVDARSFTVRGASTTGNAADEVYFNLENPGGTSLGGPGTYSLTRIMYTNAYYARTVGGIPTLRFEVDYNRGTGTVVVNTDDPVARIVSGTFGFQGFAPNGVNTANITNGTFSIRY